VILMENDLESFFFNNFNDINNINNTNYANEIENTHHNINHNVTHDSNVEMNNMSFDHLPFHLKEEECKFFGDMDYNIDFSTNKHKSESTNKILNKINKFEDTYYNNIISEPNTDAKLHDKQVLEKNLNLIENTLPGLLICFMYKINNIPVAENVLFNLVAKQFNNLRKPDGSKYKGNINKVFKSTLSSSGLFAKSTDAKWSYKEKEAVDYVLRVTEKLLTKKIENERKDAVRADDTGGSTNTDKKTPKKIKKKLDHANYKIAKVYDILDDLLNKYKNDKELGNVLKNPFKNINSSIELLQRIGSDNKCVGILMCFKFFKSIISKFVKFSSKHKKSEDLLNANSITDKLDLLNDKIDYIEKFFFAEKKKSKNTNSNININTNSKKDI